MNREIFIPYGTNKVKLNINEDKLIDVYTPADIAPVDNVAAEIKRALSNPYASKPLNELVHKKKNVVIVCDDNTRLTPAKDILPEIIDEINRGGVSDDQVTIVIALGTHREMTPKEIDDKFGEEISKRIRILNHKFNDQEMLVDLGETKNGTPISINKLVYEADFKIGIGSIVPHHIPGFSGGAKIIQPGVSGESTTGATHLLSVLSKRSYLGIEDNPVRRELDHIARKVGMNTILNTVLNRNGKVVKAFYGDIGEAFKEGVKTSRDVYSINFTEKADVVVASSHPCDLEFWQAHKTLYAADCLVKNCGIIIVITPCPEGIARTHPELVKFAGEPAGEIIKMYDNKQIKDPVAAALGIAWALIKERAQIYIVSDGISSDEAEKLGFKHFADINDAVKSAFSKNGINDRIAVLPYAPDTLPIMQI